MRLYLMHRDPGMFTDETLSGFDGVMFVHNSEEGEGGVCCVS